MIDANEGFSEFNSGISKILTKTQMCDPIFLHHGSENEINTYARGYKRIDFIFYTSTISQFIIRTGIHLFDSVTTTDHRVLYIDIMLKEYLRDSHQLIDTPQTRRLQSRFTKGVLVYKKRFIQICRRATNNEKYRYYKKSSNRKYFRWKI